jgi:hypothetical protein
MVFTCFCTNKGHFESKERLDQERALRTKYNNFILVLSRTSGPGGVCGNLYTNGAGREIL